MALAALLTAALLGFPLGLHFAGAAFLEALFLEVPQELFIVVWALDGWALLDLFRLLPAGRAKRLPHQVDGKDCLED